MKVDMTRWAGLESEAATRFAAACAWQTWARTVSLREAEAVAVRIRGGDVRHLSAAHPENAGYPATYVHAFSEVCARWARLKRSERFTEGEALLEWRGAPTPTEETAEAWVEKVRSRFGASAISGLTGVSFDPGLAEGCTIRPDGQGWRLWIDPAAAGHEAWMELRIKSELNLRPCRSWWATLPALLVALAKQAWEFQSYMGMAPTLRRQIREQLTNTSPLTGLYARCEASSWAEALRALRDAASRPELATSSEAVACDLAAWGAEGVVLEQGVFALVFYSRFGLSDALDEYTQRKWIYHPQQVAATLDGRLEDVVPVTVDIVPALECEQNCPTCSNADWRKNLADPGWLNKTREQRMMPESVLMAMLENIAAAGTKAVVFTGGGEPLFNRHTVPAIQRARQLGLEVGIYTSGILLDAATSAALIGSRVTFVRVSVNAASSAVHALVGGYPECERKYERMAAGLRSLAARNREAGKPTTVGLSFIVNDINIDEMGSLARWLREFEDDPATRGGIDYIVIRPTLAHRAHRDGEQFDRDLFKRAQCRIADEVRPTLRGTGIKVIEVSSRFSSVHDTERPYAKCTSTPWFGASGPDGSLYLCAESYYGHSRIRLGNLAENTLAEVYHSDQARSVIDGIDFDLCPPVCKMHELNKSFELFLRLGDSDRAWIKDWLLTVGQTTPQPEHVNFI